MAELPKRLPGNRGQGRKLGSKNKDRDAILAMLQDEAYSLNGQKGYDPLRSILRIVEDPTNNLSNKDRIHGNAVIAEYVHSKRKAIVMQGDITISHEQALEELDGEIKEE